MKLLAIIIAFALYHSVDKPGWLKSFAWIKSLHREISGWTASAQLQWVWLMLIPNLVLWIVFAGVLDLYHDGIGLLLASVAVLYYCLGPDTIAGDLASRKIKQRLNVATDAPTSAVVTAMTDAALQRWFGVFFWYVVLGIYGAISYRVACYLVHHIKPASPFAAHALRVLEFPVTVLMTASLALASDFDRIWRHCKQYLTRETLQTMNCQFLYKSMDFAVAKCEIETEDENKDHIIEHTTFAVLKRMLVVWLVMVALLVLFTKG
ncbi:hypothetical protein [Marinicella meishanensis]|uniref:hypothetical protein n=1 Tax=Marinicella meishanensis TaxID=2873263 RepID=UPI001CBAB2AD|nr:hypothetical protein [Marinicella sp. NBU2979]